MPLEIIPEWLGFGSISLRLTKQGSDFDFLGFEVWETDSQYAVSEEVFINRVEDVTLTVYTFHFTKPQGIYYFNGYAIDFARNRSVPVNLSIVIDREVSGGGPLDPEEDTPRKIGITVPSTGVTFSVEGEPLVNQMWLVTAGDLI